MSKIFRGVPKKVFTKDGYLDFLRHIGNIIEGMDFITNHFAELDPDDKSADSLYDASILFNKLYDEYVKTAI